jgi:hypothetical protein
MRSENLKSPPFKRVVLFIGLAVLMGGLLLFTYLSYFNRHWADDWCYNADFRSRGFIETVKGYAYDTTYTPSRYSVTIFAGLLQVFDVAGTQWMTPLTIWLWVVGLTWLFWNVVRLAGFQPATALMTFFSALIVYFSIYLTPHLYQSLYWRTGHLTYTTPLVLTTWIFVLITRQGLSKKPSKWETALAGLLALLAGGCSEAAATVLVSSLAIYIGLATIYRQQVWAQKTFWIAVVSLFFGVVAMCLLIFSPTTQIRKGRYGDPTPLVELPHLIFNYTYAFFVLSVKDYHHILIALISALVGFVYPVTGEQSFRFNRYILLDVMIVIITILLVAASLTPSIYVEKGLPAARTMIIPRFIAAFGFALGGWVAGSALGDVAKSSTLQMGALALLLISFAFPVYTIITATNSVEIYSQRTRAWDIREAMIDDALLAGSTRVTVEAIDGFPVGGIRDFDPPGKTGYWITRCAGDYYGIKLDVVLP